MLSGPLCIKPPAAGVMMGKAIPKTPASAPASGNGMGLIKQWPKRAKRRGRSAARRWPAGTVFPPDLTIVARKKDTKFFSSCPSVVFAEPVKRQAIAGTFGRWVMASSTIATGYS